MGSSGLRENNFLRVEYIIENEEFKDREKRANSEKSSLRYLPYGTKKRF
jgi:hypothetical protein